MAHIYLAKADDSLISHCRCPSALITFPPQMDCPWCGCGWLFTCIECRKAFTFAKGVMVEEPWEEIAQRDIWNRSKARAPADQVALWVEAMKQLLRDVKVDEEYVALDGMFIPVSANKVVFDGWHSHHDFRYVPQVAALKDRSILDSTLGSEAYWQQNRLSTTIDDDAG